MSRNVENLAIDRANRDAARAVFTERLARIKADLEARGVGSRVAGSVVEGTSDALDAGLDVARERKGLIAGTIGALLLWIFRQPLFDAAASLFTHNRGEDADEETEDDTRDESD